MTELQDAGVLV